MTVRERCTVADPWTVIRPYPAPRIRPFGSDPTYPALHIQPTYPALRTQPLSHIETYRAVSLHLPRPTQARRPPGPWVQHDIFTTMTARQTDGRQRNALRFALKCGPKRLGRSPLKIPLLYLRDRKRFSFRSRESNITKAMLII